MAREICLGAASMRFITPSEIETIIGKRTKEVSGCSSSRGIEILEKQDQGLSGRRDRDDYSTAGLGQSPLSRAAFHCHLGLKQCAHKAD